MNTAHKYLIVIAGPTGAGKTNAAIQLAKHFHTEILSADARQFYREMSIGTAKPSDDELAAVKHHFINSLSIHDNYNAGKYEVDVQKVLNELYVKFDTLILCGGSGLFIHAALHGLDKLPAANPEIRNQLQEKFRKEGIASLQNMLNEKDPAYYNTIDVHNPHRIIRALEICIITGKKYSELRTQEMANRNFSTINIFLNPDRKVLYENINKRVDAMMQLGLLNEVASLYQYRNLPALNTVGYKELFAYMDGSYDLATGVEKIKQNTRNYAKRQITWFNKYFTANTFTPEQDKQMRTYIQSKLQ